MFVKNQEKIDKVIALFKENVKPAKVFTSLNSQGVTVSKSTVYSQWEIYSREEPLKKGRKPLFSDESLQQMKENIEMQSNCGKCLTTNSVKSGLLELFKEKAQNPLTPLPSERTLYERAIELFPETAKNASCRCQERCLALEDLFSAISHVAVSYGIQEIVPAEITDSVPLDKLRIHPQDIYNIDGVATLLDGITNQTVRLVAGGKKKLKEKRLNATVSTSTKSSKRRTIKQLYLTSSDGFLHTAILVIKDRKVKQLAFHCLSAFDGGYQVWLVLSPVKTKVKILYFWKSETINTFYFSQNSVDSTLPSPSSSSSAAAASVTSSPSSSTSNDVLFCPCRLAEAAVPVDSESQMSIPEEGNNTNTNTNSSSFQKEKLEYFFSIVKIFNL
jgi:hypothetical protein